ncbi:MAG TPA: glycoside hydrolase family 32 protein [Propionibacteriaceae bacterium]
MTSSSGTDALSNQASLEERAPADRHRPAFHFVSPAGWLNDPNGVGRWNGRYHLFYQHNPKAAVHADIHWGHASSTDLVHWNHEPIALAPSAGPDADGCWSGVLVDDHGTPTLVYSGHRDGVGQRACLAVGDPDLRRWRKDPANPVIAEPPGDLDLLEFRDHCVWRHGEAWFQLVGSGIRGKGGTALLYRSGDLRSWDFLGPILVGDALDRDVWTGTVWECVDLFRLGVPTDAAPDVLLLSVWDDQVTHYGVYQTGLFDGERFHLAQKHLLDLGLNYFYAAQSFPDEDGRRVAFGWIQEGRPVAAQVEAGWSGVMSLPRELTSTEAGRLEQRPVAEVNRLRHDERSLGAVALTTGQSRWLTDLAGDQLDLELIVQVPIGAALTLGLLASPDQAEQTLLRLHAENTGMRLELDRSHSSLDTTVDLRLLSGAIPVDADRKVALRVLIDHSVVEIFANGRPLTARVYPTRRDAHGLYLAAAGADIMLDSLTGWQMNGSW